MPSSVVQAFAGLVPLIKRVFDLAHLGGQVGQRDDLVDELLVVVVAGDQQVQLAWLVARSRSSSCSRSHWPCETAPMASSRMIRLYSPEAARSLYSSRPFWAAVAVLARR